MVDYYTNDRLFLIGLSSEPILREFSLPKRCTPEQIQAAYERKLRVAENEQDDHKIEWIKRYYEKLLSMKNCEECKKWVIPVLINYPHFCSQQCLDFYKTKISAAQQIANQLQQKRINRVEDLGGSLVEIQALFPWNCQCDHPWTYEHHIKNCLTTKEQIEDFKNQFLNIIARIQINQNAPPINPQPSNPPSPNPILQQDSGNEQGASNQPANSSGSSSYSSPSFSSESSGDTPVAEKMNDNRSSSTTNLEPKSKDETPSKPASQPESFSPAEAVKTSDKTSSERVDEIEEKINKAVNKPTEKVLPEEIQNTLKELEQIEQEKNESSDSSRLEKKAKIGERINDLKVSLQIEAIKQIDNQQIPEARQLAKEIIKEYVQQQKITVDEEKELLKELESLTTSQSVAQHIKQLAQRIKAKKLQKTIIGDKNQPQERQKWLPWTIGGGIVLTGAIGLVIWSFTKKKGESKNE